MILCHLRSAAIGFGLIATLACQHAAHDRNSDDGSGGPASSDPAATIDGRTISVGELDAYIKEQLFNDQTSNRTPIKLYEVRVRAIRGMIDQILVDEAAAAAGLSPDEFFTQQIESRGEVPEEEIAAFYEENRNRMGGRELDEVRDRIAEYLKEQRAVTIVEELRAQADSEILLEQARIEVEPIGPSKGPDDAPVTIVEFSDFECPYCKRVVPTIEQILAKYPTQVRFVFRNLPLRIHARAQAAAEAAACADKQGMFWEYHDAIFADTQNLADEDLVRRASDLGLETEAFRQCLENRETQAIVDADVAAADELLITGTPSFVINGIPRSGAQSLEAFSEIIDAEIARITAEGGSNATR